MISFFVCLAILIVGFFIYSKVTEKVFGPDDRKTPALTMTDGTDYVPMGTARIFLIQLLNIAGLGPIFGALAGACWGPSVFLWITFGTLLGGGVHDYMVGMMSMRHKGASVSELTGTYLGTAMKQVMRVFSVVLLVLVGVTFSTGPANLLAMLTPNVLDAKFWLAVVLIYYWNLSHCYGFRSRGSDFNRRLSYSRNYSSKSSSIGYAYLAYNVYFCCLWSYLWFSCNPVSINGPLPSK